MKVKEAVAELEKVGSEKLVNSLIDLYTKEFDRRKALRFGGRDCLASSFDDLNKEMDEWVRKVVLGVGMTDAEATSIATEFTKLTHDISRQYIHVRRSHD